MAKLRLDQAMVDRGIAPSRARARDAILRGMVQLDGNVASKPAQSVQDGQVITLDDPASGYVSRAALKLLKALDLFGFDPAGKICVDLGASTGGFCQVLLERKAQHVYGIDVGHDQMHASLRDNPHLSVLEGVNARALDAGHIDQPFQGLVSDMSFISLRLALPPALEMAAPGCFGAFLVKPQFEVGKDGIGKGGLVRDAQQGLNAAQAIADWMDGPSVETAGWRVLDMVPSPILGGDGNKEYLLGAVKDRG